MKKVTFITAALLTAALLSANNATDDNLLQQDLFSNYGGWVNLTAGYTRDTTDADPMKSEIAVCGNTVHVVWADIKSNTVSQPEGYDVWYRRSTDGGATWEDARSIYKRRAEGWNGYCNILQAEGNYVHILVPDNYDGDNEDKGMPRLMYLRSTDGGANFTNKQIATGPWEYYGIKYALIKAEGENVVIAYHIDQPDNQNIVVCRSTDYGANFNSLTVTLPQAVHMMADLQLKDGKWALVASSQSWYATLLDGRVYVATGDMTDETAALSQLAPQLSDNGYYCQILDRRGYNGDELNHHPVMAITGNGTIHLMFTGATEMEKDEELNDKVNFSHLLYIRSDDFGQTWSNIVTIPEANNSTYMLVAQGQNVYAIVGNGEKRWIAYSNDNGNTWKANKTMCYGTTCDRWGCTNLDSPRAYDLVIDPNDPTGNTAWYIGSKWLTVQTKDGFNSLSYANRLDAMLRIGVVNERGSQMSPLLAIDANGFNHWLMREFVGVNDLGGHNACQLFYRKEMPEPAPSDKNMALHMYEKTLVNNGDFPKNRVAVPLRENMHLDSAMSVAFWVRVDSLDTQTSLIYMHSNTENTSGDEQFYVTSYSNPGFAIGLDSHKDGYDEKTEQFNVLRAQVKAFLNTDKSDDGNGTILYNYSPYNDDVHMICEPEVWHSVVFTWDGRKLGQNMELYLDGLLLATGSLSGRMEFGTNPIVIGNAANFQNNQDWYMDELQIWNRALTYDEVKQFAGHKPVSQKGCVINYGFDGTLKDLSGNGNDAMAQLNCEFTEYEGLLLPEPKMQLAKDWSGRVVTYTDQTENGEAIYWRYDIPGYDLGTSDNGDAARHTQHEFNNWENGITNPVMIARGGNACTPAYGTVLISGLNKVEPDIAGQADGVMLKIYGGYEWNKDLNVRLHREGQTDIIGSWVKRSGYDETNTTGTDVLHYASFDLANADLGAWDVIVDEDTLFGGFSVEEFRAPDVWADLTGWDRMLINRSKNFYIEYGNRGNVDAYNVPFILYVSADAEVTLGFENPLYPPQLTDETVKATLDTMASVVFDAGGEYGRLRAFPLLLPRVTAGSRYSLPFSVKSSKNVDMYYFLGEPWGPLEFDKDGNPIVVQNGDGQAGAQRHTPAYEIDENSDRTRYKRFDNNKVDCLLKYLGWGTIDATVGSVPLLGCAYQVGFKMWFQAIEDNPEDRIGNFMTNVFSAVFTCAMDLNPYGWGLKAIFLANSAFNIAMNIDAMNDCLHGTGKVKKILCVSSYDPNEMIGPSGFGDEHYIKPAPEMSYTVTFENKSTATAPAHEVFVTDTLDKSRYDLESFGFTSFGWADTTIRVEGQNMKEFTQDVKLEAKNMIVRVNGKLDTEKGVASWSFITLDQKGNVEEDPDKGFLVPNNINHEGEGFVTFAINHLDGLANGARIENEAVIVFDANKPIRTNTYVNTIDNDLPQSNVTNATIDGENMLVEWTASDASSGVSHVQLFVKENDEEYKAVEGVHKGGKATLPCKQGTKYCFAAVAIDNVGWRENKDQAKFTCEFELQSPTAVEQIAADGKTAVRKELRDGVLYIIRDGKTYNALGTEVR